MRNRPGTAIRNPHLDRARSSKNKTQNMTDTEYSAYLEEGDNYVDNPDSDLYNVQPDLFDFDREDV